MHCVLQHHWPLDGWKLTVNNRPRPRGKHSLSIELPSAMPPKAVPQRKPPTKPPPASKQLKDETAAMLPPPVPAQSSAILEQEVRALSSTLRVRLSSHQSRTRWLTFSLGCCSKNRSNILVLRRYTKTVRRSLLFNPVHLLNTS